PFQRKEDGLSSPSVKNVSCWNETDGLGSPSYKNALARRQPSQMIDRLRLLGESHDFAGDVLLQAQTADVEERVHHGRQEVFGAVRLGLRAGGVMVGLSDDLPHL